MDLLKLQYFIAVASSDSMSQAAKSMHVSQSTLSMAIKSLESEFGTPLYQRDGRRLRLTPAGSYLLGEARALVAYATRVAESMQQFQQPDSTQEITIAMETAGFANEGGILFRQLTGIPVRSTFADRNRVRAMLGLGQAELAVTLFDCSNQNLESVCVLQSEMQVAVRQDSPLAAFDQLEFFQLQDQTLVTLPESYSFRTLYESYFLQHGMRPAAIHEVRDQETLPIAVRQGFGITFLPKHFITAPTPSGVACPPGVKGLPVSGPPLMRNIYLTRLRDRPLPPAAEQFYQFLIRFGDYTGRVHHYPTLQEARDALLLDN